MYDSARELLAIDVRQRKGEQLEPEEKPAEQVAQPAEVKQEVQYTNKRFKADSTAPRPVNLRCVVSRLGR